MRGESPLKILARERPNLKFHQQPFLFPNFFLFPNSSLGTKLPKQIPFAANSVCKTLFPSLRNRFHLSLITFHLSLITYHLSLFLEAHLTFCPNCQSYLKPDITTCPTCKQPRPAASAIQAAWLLELNQIPVATPLLIGDGLLIPTQDAGQPPRQSTLYHLSLSGNRLQAPLPLETGQLISGLQTLEVSEIRQVSEIPQISEIPQVSEIPQISTLLATYSSNPLNPTGMLLALDAAKQEIWRWSPEVQTVSAPALVGETIWVTTNTGRLVGLNLTTGLELTSIPLATTPSLAAPTIVDEVAYIPCRGPHLLAVGLDGQTRWHFEAAGGWLNQTPLSLGKRLLAVTNLSGVIVALNQATGQLLWKVELGPKIGKRLSSPATDGKHLYLGARGGLYAFDLTDGRQTWRFLTKEERRIEATPVIVAGVVYAASHDHHLYALDAATGQELWRYPVKRRIAVAPLIITSPQPLALIADQGGTITAITRPLSPPEHEAAGQWLDAASGYAALGQLRQAADLLTTHNEPFKAAQLWHVAGELELAAKQYEIAKCWAQAANLWQQLNQPLKQAEALEHHARSLSSQITNAETCAEAWEVVAQAFEATGEPERAESCRREVARHRHLPYLVVEVEPDDLILNTWSRLHFVVHNRGFGPARQLIIRARGSQFEGQVAETRQIITLQAGQTRQDRLDVRPLGHGNSVPLRVSIVYQDNTKSEHTWQNTLYLSVAKTKIAVLEKSQPSPTSSSADTADQSNAINPSRQFESAIVRFFTNDNRIVGTGFLIAEQQVLTCAHVVAQALNISADTPELPTTEIQLDFPLVAPGHILTARVVCWQPKTDVAGLVLAKAPPSNVQTAHLITATNLWDHPFRAFGFPADFDQGVWASGLLRSRQASAWVQIEDVKQTGYFVQPGFSGGPVWDESLGGVVGMTVAADMSSGVRAAFMIPTEVLLKVWPALSAMDYH